MVKHGTLTPVSKVRFFPSLPKKRIGDKMSKENVFSITYSKVNEKWRATGFAPTIGTVTRYGETKEIAMKNLYNFVSNITDQGKHW